MRVIGKEFCQLANYEEPATIQDFRGVLFLLRMKWKNQDSVQEKTSVILSGESD